MPNAELEQLELLSQIDELIARLSQWAELPSSWEPQNRCRGLLRRLLARADSVRMRIESPLIVATFGGTGTGKSSLVNAIIGQESSLSGRQRPTTMQPVLIVHPDVEIERLGLPLDDFEIVRNNAPILRDFIIVDCPDPDTTEKGNDSEKENNTEKEIIGSNLERLHRLLPLCDVLIYTSTQQKYRSGRVSAELNRAATGCRLLFVQTHADLDSDIRNDWKEQLVAEQYTVPELFFVDSLKALREQQQGIRPTGDFGRLLELLTTRLAASQRVAIRRSNLVDLIQAALLSCEKQLTDAWPNIEQLQAELEQQRQQMTEVMSSQLHGELQSSRHLWERRLLSAVTEKWGVSPFSMILRFYHGLGNFIASTTFFRARTSAQMALIGAVQGGRWLRSRKQEKQSDEQLEQLSTLGINDDLLRESQFVITGYATSAQLDSALTAQHSLGELRDEAARAQDRFLGDAGQKIDVIIDRLSMKNSGRFTRFRYEFLFIIYVGFILLRVGKNFFYDSFLKPLITENAIYSSPFLGWDFWVTAGVFFVLWTGFLVMLFTGRLRFGLNQELQQLANELTSLRLSHGLFPAIETGCRDAEQQRHRLNALSKTTQELRDSIADSSPLGQSPSASHQQ